MSRPPLPPKKPGEASSGSWLCPEMPFRNRALALRPSSAPAADRFVSDLYPIGGARRESSARDADRRVAVYCRFEYPSLCQLPEEK
jgi:hypothetical protein